MGTETYTTGGMMKPVEMYHVDCSLKIKLKEKIMGSEILHWFIIGFFVGIGYGLATWLLGKLLR